MTIQADPTGDPVQEQRARGPVDVSWASALVVDDIPENRDLLLRRLKRLGLRDIEEAADGREALDRLAERAFDLVLLDIMMPGVNGYQVLDELNRDGRTHDFPVVVISALSEIDAVARCLELGAEDFIFKPFNRPYCAPGCWPRWRRSSFATSRAGSWPASAPS